MILFYWFNMSTERIMKKIIYLIPLVILAAAVDLYAEAPNLLIYQGRLKDSGQAITGTRSVDIRLCDALTGGNCYSYGAQSVNVSNGLFRSTFTVPSDAIISAGNWYLEIQVAGVPLIPREQLTSSAYSLFAATATYAYNLAAAPGADGVDISTDIHLTGGKYYGDGSELSHLPAATIADNSITSAKILDGTIIAADIAVSTISLDKLNQSGCVAGQIPKWNGSAWACAADNGTGAGSYTADEVSLHVNASTFSALGSSVTLQGNSFNAANKLVLLDGTARLPAVDASQVLNVSSVAVGGVYTNAILDSAVTNAKLAGSIDDSKLNQITTAGKVSDYALSSNVELLNTNQTASGKKTFTSTFTITANAFSVGGSTFVVQAGNVGIGVAGPAYKLDVNGDVNLASGSVFRIGGAEQAGSSEWTQTGNDIYRNIGNVGIGTSAPAALLTLNENITGLTPAVPTLSMGNTAGDSEITLGNSFTNRISLHWHYNSYGELNVPGGPLILNSSHTSVGIGTNNNPLGTLSVHGTGANYVFYASTDSNGGSANFVVANSGNVGIGTPNPANPLEVNGVIKSLSGGFTFPDGTQMLPANGAVFDNSSSTDVILAADTDANGSGVISLTTRGLERMRIENAGNVGIAMTAPTVKLGVSGGILATSSITAQGNINAAYYQISSSTVLELLGDGTSLVVGPAPSGHSATGAGNTFVGYGTANASGSGNGNTYIGFESGESNTSGTNNTALGYGSGIGNNGGADNIFVGWQAGYDVVSGSRNIVIGYDQAASGPGVNDKLNIGGVLFGDLAAGRIGIGTNAPGAKLEVAGQVKITGGAPGAGKVLTSDANGLAAWQVAASTLSIGDSYGGGKIFWLDASGKHGLIAAIVDAGNAAWDDGTGFTIGTSTTAIYAGRANTAVIVSTKGAGSYAAKVCADYAVTSNNEYYDDWYLPSKYEWSQLYVKESTDVSFTASNYWSSTEASATTAVYWSFSSGMDGTGTKAATAGIRCIRAW